MIDRRMSNGVLIGLAVIVAYIFLAAANASGYLAFSVSSY